MVVPKISGNSFVNRSNIAELKAVSRSANQTPNFVLDGLKAVNGFANQNLPNSYLESEWTTMHGERRGISALMHRPGLQDFEIERIPSSLKSLGFDMENGDTNASRYYCYEALAADGARYQAMVSKYGESISQNHVSMGTIPSRDTRVTEHNKQTKISAAIDSCGKAPSSAFSKDVHHQNNRDDRFQATVNNMGIEHGRMRKEPDNQSSGKATAKIAGKTAAAASTLLRGNEDSYDTDSDPAHCFSFFVQDRLRSGSRMN